jgi:hypothetical protein
MVKVLTVTALAAMVLCTGCQGGSLDFFHLNKNLPDPQAPVKIVQKFCQDNPAASTSVEITLLVRDRRWLSVPVDVQSQLVTAMQGQSQPLKSGQDVANIRGISNIPLARIVFSGQSYALVMHLDSFGLALGNGGYHRLINPAMAEALHSYFMAQGLLRGGMGKSLEVALKKASGEMNLYQPLPPASDVEEGK